MTAKRLISIVATGAVCALGAPAGSALAATDAQQATSANWSGYVVSPSSGSDALFKSVSGSWLAPTATSFAWYELVPRRPCGWR
jgi:hypothetical protein